MAKKKAAKPLKPKTLQDQHKRIIAGFDPVQPDQLDSQRLLTHPTEYIVVRDYVTYSAYEDPIEE